MHEHDELEQSQDLAAHFYTGRGLRAKHQSEIVHEKNSYSENAEEKNFQIALVEKLEKQYQDELNKLNAKRSANLEKLNAVKGDAAARKNHRRLTDTDLLGANANLFALAYNYGNVGTKLTQGFYRTAGTV